MRFYTPILAAMVLMGCVHCPISNRDLEPIAHLVTPELVNRHLINGASPTEAPKVSQEGRQMILDFGGYCEVRIARGGELLSDAKYGGMKTNVFTSILGSLNTDTNNDPAFPKIGSRAMVQGLDTTIVTFTTSDRHFDVEITALMHRPEMVESVEIAKDLSQIYDNH